MRARAMACAFSLAMACTQQLRVLDREPEVSMPSEGCMCEAPFLCEVDRCIDSSGVRSVGMGYRHVCRVEDGELSCWGANRQAQLGLSDTDDRRAPTRVGDESSWLSVAAAEEHTCAIMSPGHLYCWGNNSAGQLGTSNTASQRLPTRVAGPDDFYRVSCGGQSSCALRRSGQLYCWGDTARMFAGPGDVMMDDTALPDRVVVPIEIQPEDRWLEVSLGSGHACAINADRELHCWGDNDDGQLGNGSTSAMPRPPAPVGRTGWQHVAAGQHHTCGIREGELYCWGRADAGELGPGGGRSSNVPVRVGTESDWKHVAVGEAHTCAVRARNRLYCWGRNNEGQVAQPVRETIPMPSLVSNSRLEFVFCGAQHTCALDTGEVLYCWGANETGQLGIDGTFASPVPVMVE